MVGHIGIKTRINKELGMLNIYFVNRSRFFFGTIDEWDYFLKKIDIEKVKKIVESYVSLSECEVKKRQMDLVWLRFWDIQITNEDLKKMIEEIDGYVRKL